MKTIIPQLRKQRKLSQEELALAVGVTRQTITSIEVGKYTASLALAYKIARYFGKTIEEIFDFSELPFQSIKYLQSMLDMLCKVCYSFFAKLTVHNTLR